MPDFAIPIVFPDYLIAVATPRSLRVPDLLPGVDLLPDRLALPVAQARVPELGHAGILLIEGSSGTTKYYEYGRYDSSKRGAVMNRTIRNVKMQSDGQPSHASLAYTLSQISAAAGQNGRISAAYIAVPGGYGPMLDYCRRREAERNNPLRAPYNLFSNSCVHFMSQTLAEVNIELPTMIDPRPNSYIRELRRMHPKLDYSRADHTLTLDLKLGQLAHRTRATSQPAAA